MLDWPLVGLPTRLITHANRGFMEHIARRTCRSAAVHINDSPVRWTRQRVAESLKQSSLSGLACSSAGRGQNIRCPHARGLVRTFSRHPGTTGHAFCCIRSGAAFTSRNHEDGERCRENLMREDARRWETDMGTEAVERSAVMTVLYVGTGNSSAIPHRARLCISVGSPVALASLASRFILHRATY